MEMEAIDHMQKKYELFRKDLSDSESGSDDSSENNDENIEVIEHVEKIDESPVKRKIPTADKKSKPPPPKKMRITKKRSNLIEPEQKVEELMILAADTFSLYTPSKLNIQNAKPHPDAVIETASMAIISPPEITYQQSIANPTIEEGKLSALQLEAVVYASQMHENTLPDGFRAGFFIGMIFIVIVLVFIKAHFPRTRFLSFTI